METECISDFLIILETYEWRLWREVPPDVIYKLRYCIHQNKILFFNIDNCEAYLFSTENISDPSIFDFYKLLVERRSSYEKEFPDNIILFSFEDTIYIKGGFLEDHIKQ